MKEESDVHPTLLPPIRWGAVSDIGKVRKENQDAFLADPESGLFLVSDGMGGHQAGALASEIVVNVLPTMVADYMRKLQTGSTSAIKSMLKKAILELSKRMRTESAGQIGFAGLGATLVMAILRSDRLYIANMGDSRAYRLRKGKLLQLSEDHTVVASLLRAGEIKPDEAKYHPARGQLTRSIGMKEEVYPYVRTLALKDGDRLLLCSDGLTVVVDNEQITSILRSEAAPQNAGQALVDAANAAGGPDNITAVVIDWMSSNDICA